ncbi:MAG TPA: XTP/dITP diphosphatase [Thermoplasmata archaeon]|nr:XTP/dITP diphosphatase [Thermoplasmata archaeon]
MRVRFVTSNEGKFREAGLYLEPYGVELEQVTVGYPEIQAETLEEVARYGADVLARRMDRFIIEDSGFFLDAQGGFPGVYSKFVHATIGLEGILRLVGDDRRAHFESCILYHDGVPHIFRGDVRGHVAEEPRGTGGFGYDPIFVPEGHDRTFAEMEPEEKNALSHRGRALAALAAFLAERTGVRNGR